MRIYKYVFEFKDIDVDFSDLETVIYFVEKDLLELFPEFILDIKVHSPSDAYYFFFISDIDDQLKIIKKLEEGAKEISHTFDYKVIYKDLTYDILNNIDNYDSIPNFTDKNTLLDYYYKVFNKDSVLDKIIERGINSLNNHDKEVLKRI